MAKYDRCKRTVESVLALMQGGTHTPETVTEEDILLGGRHLCGMLQAVDVVKQGLVNLTDEQRGHLDGLRGLLSLSTDCMAEMLAAVRSGAVPDAGKPKPKGHQSRF